jgi:hypothetical protein
MLGLTQRRKPAFAATATSKHCVLGEAGVSFGEAPGSISHSGKAILAARRALLRHGGRPCNEIR